MVAQLVLRGLAAAAAFEYKAVKLNTLSDGTYWTNATINATSVDLLVDSSNGGLLVKCSALSADGKCEDKPSALSYSMPFPRIGRSVIVDPAVTEVEFGGLTYESARVYVVFDELPELGATVQGILGLARQGPADKYGFKVESSLYSNGNLKGMGIQVDDDAVPYLQVNGLNTQLNARRGIWYSEDLIGTPRASCVQLKEAGTANDASTDICGPERYPVSFDSASPVIRMLPAAVTALETKLSSICTAVKNSTVVDHFLCSSRVDVPMLVVDFKFYRFSLDPLEYTVPVGGSRPYKLLIGSLDSDSDVQLVLGVPFVRKYPIFLSTAITGSLLDDLTKIHCALDSTCWSVSLQKSKAPLQTSKAPSKSASNRNSGMYIVVGVIGGLTVIGVCICMLRSFDKRTDEQPSKAKDPTTDNVELPERKTPPDEANESDANDPILLVAIVPTLEHGNGAESTDFSDYASDSSEEFYEFRDYRRRLQERRRLKRESKQMKRDKRRKSKGSRDNSYEAVRSP